MAGQNGVNPHAAADLLRQKIGHREDDNQDQIDSSGSTPSGIATPQPDPSDKRLPGIMHSYFAQVRSGFGSTSSSISQRSPASTTSTLAPAPTPATAPTPPSLNGDETKTHPRQGEEGEATGGTSSCSGSIIMVERDQVPDLPPPAPSGVGSEEPKHEELSQPPNPNLLPTPPLSSACSLLEKEKEVAENGAPVGNNNNNGVGSICRALKNFILSNNSSPAPDARRHTSHPVSSISTVSAPASQISSKHSLPSSAGLTTSDNSLFPSHDVHHVSKSAGNISKLTENAAIGPRAKNTPPLTPRAMSNENHPHTEKRSALSTTSSPAPANRRSDPGNEKRSRKSKEASPSQSTTSSDGPPVGSLKGKLSVQIAEARGLRPSVDPYVVCVFEWNEYISKGASEEGGEDTEEKSKGKKDTLGSVPIQRTDSDSGRPLAIPMKSRQSSNNSQMDNNHDQKNSAQVTDPQWNHEAVFDVLGDASEIDVSVYDRTNQEAFLGHVRLYLNFKEEQTSMKGWFPLSPRGAGDDNVTGEIHLQMDFQKTDKKQFGPNDFTILKLIGRGTFGQVYQVRKDDTQRIYAMKVLSKKVIIQKKEIAHTLGERNILVRTAMADSPFIVGLKFSFQTPTDLYLVTDYMSGGELFWHLQKEGRFQEPRAKFYIAELILALQRLHQHDIVYRDLKPENILLDANGHIALCDFGLSKANLTKNDTTNTFCGTTEYLAPEVLLDEQGYTKMVDFWSLGVLVFEMCCGWSPFYAEDTQQMYKNIAFGKVRFPRDALSTEGRNFVKGLLNRNPRHRLGATDDAAELMAHPFFHDIDWEVLRSKNVIPPFKPKLKSPMDTSNFDPEFTNALDHPMSLNARAAAIADGQLPTSTPLSPGTQANFKGFTYVNESTMDQHLQATTDDRMDEDFKDEESWPQSNGPDDSKGDHRMSGVVKTGEEGGIFNDDDHFDM